MNYKGGGGGHHAATPICCISCVHCLVCWGEVSGFHTLLWEYNLDLLLSLVKEYAVGVWA